MKPRRFREFWKDLDTESRRRLAAHSSVSNEFLRGIASSGRVGRYVAKTIADSLVELALVDGPPDRALRQLFPDAWSEFDSSRRAAA